MRTRIDIIGSTAVVNIDGNTFVLNVYELHDLAKQVQFAHKATVEFLENTSREVRV